MTRHPRLSSPGKTTFIQNKTMRYCSTVLLWRWTVFWLCSLFLAMGVTDLLCPFVTGYSLITTARSYITSVIRHLFDKWGVRWSRNEIINTAIGSTGCIKCNSTDNRICTAFISKPFRRQEHGLSCMWRTGDSELLSGFPWPIIFKPEITK